MSETVISVGYERKFSDGNFGSEGMSLSITETWASEPTNEQVVSIAAALRRDVLVFLASSVAPRVRNAANAELNPRPAQRADEADLEEMPF